MLVLRNNQFRTTIDFFYEVAGPECTAQCHLCEKATSALHLCLFTELRVRNALHNATYKKESPSQYTCDRLQDCSTGTHYAMPPLRTSNFRIALEFVYRLACLERTTQCHL